MLSGCIFNQVYNSLRLLSDTQKSSTGSTTHSHHPETGFRPSGRRSVCQNIILAATVYVLGLSSSVQAQNYNPNNYDTSKIVQAMRNPHSDLSLVVAHRGLHATLDAANGVPENSLQAIGDAAQAGIEIVEVDIKVTQDGVPILSHDTSWGREWCGLSPYPVSQPFNPFTPPGSSYNDSSNPAVNATSLSNTRSFLGETVLRDSVSLVNDTQAHGCTAGNTFRGVYPPTLQDVLDYMTKNKIAVVLSLDIKDDATAQICWSLIKGQKDYRGNPYSQSVVFKMPGQVYKSATEFQGAFGSVDYSSVLLWPFYGTGDISPQTASIDDSYGTDEPSIAGFGSEANIIASILSIEQSGIRLVGLEVNLKQPGGILTSVLAAAQTRNTTAGAPSVGSFNPEAEYIDPSDASKTAQFFIAAGPNSAHCCYKLSDLFYNGGPNGQPSDTADDRGDLNFLIAAGDNIITTDSAQSVASTLAGLGKRNISYLQGSASSGGNRSIVSLRVMPIGDSLTEGFQSTTGNGYRGPLQQDIQNQGQTIQFVGDRLDGTMSNPENEGFSTQEINFIANFAVPAAASWRPNVAMILAGTNDVANFDDIAGAPGRLDSMIGGVFQSAPDATLLIAGIPRSVDNTFNTNLQAFNNSVQALISSRQNSGQHIEYVDMSNLDPTTIDKADPWHPNDAGYKVMGDNFSGAIEDVMNKGWVTSPVANNRTVGSGSGRRGNGTPGPPPGPGKWQPQSEVANGGGAALGSFVQMADINGDGRPDYLVVDKSGAVTAYLNAGPNPNGGWVWLLQPWALTNGSGAPGSQTRFADLNGDGRADFLSVADDGSVSGYLNGGPKPDGTGWVWLPQRNIANGVGAPGSQIQFADINGDGRADYLNVSPNGAVTAYFNGGLAADGSSWTWPIKIQIANGVSAPYGSQVQFADINGDGFDDYLVTSSIDGTVTAWMNGGQISSTEWNLYSVGQVAPGIGAPSLDLRVVFADINGDGKADYLAVNRNTAAVSAFLNNGLDTSPVQGWLPLGPIAAGLGGPNIDIQMADIDGDGRADYIAVNTLTGSASGYLNGGQKTGGWIWFPQPKIASGVGAAAGSTYRFADVNGDGKADYLVVGFMNSVDAYLSVGPGPDGWIWSSKHPLYPGSSNWANIGAAAAVHFADMDGDGFADFLVYFNGNVVGSINTQQFSDSSPDTFLDSMDQPYDHAFAYSPGAGSNITLANIDIGDPKRADYLAIGDGGSVTALLNQGVAQAPGTQGSYINWKSVGQIAAGAAPAGTSVLFADINGDGRADYLVVDNNTGAITAWLNNGAGMNQ